jgi:hypothetical protein
MSDRIEKSTLPYDIRAQAQDDVNWPELLLDAQHEVAAVTANAEAMALELHETILAKDELFDLVAAVTAERDRLREGLATHRHTNECLEYAARTGAPFCIVSCGDSWRVLNWPAPATEEVQG